MAHVASYLASTPSDGRRYKDPRLQRAATPIPPPPRVRSYSQATVRTPGTIRFLFPSHLQKFTPRVLSLPRETRKIASSASPPAEPRRPPPTPRLQRPPPCAGRPTVPRLSRRDAPPAAGWTPAAASTSSAACALLRPGLPARRAPAVGYCGLGVGPRLHARRWRLLQESWITDTLAVAATVRITTIFSSVPFIILS